MAILKKLLGSHWTHLPLRIRGVAALSLPIISLLINSLFIFALYRSQQETFDWIAHTYQVRLSFQNIVAELSNVAANERVYQLNGDHNAFEAAEVAASNALKDVDKVQLLTADNLRQQVRIPELRLSIIRRIQFLREAPLTQTEAPDRETISQMLRQSLMRQLRQMDKEEASLLRSRQAALKHTHVLQIASQVVTLCVGAVSGIIGILWFLQTEEGIRRMTEQLEDRVVERTKQLAEANRELEAFSSSVSHDLRAPLRSVDGFARILLRDYSEILDDKGRDMVRRMRAATIRMAQLIEDLLRLSRISRSEVVRQSSDLSALAAAVCDDLRASHPARGIDVQISPGVRAEADPRLARIVLENLLGNAWKFTRNVATAHIEFGAIAREGDSACYYVRDNGAGFNMASAGQLFTPFQRLHSSSEFEGSGVGLATVQRVIQRHRGRIWADSKPGEGATFFFTLDEHAAQDKG